jgi:hypothetical protein
LKAARVSGIHLAMFAIVGLGRYLAQLTPGRLVLWCYAIWYTVNVWNHFDSNPRLWLTSLGLSGIIGLALLLSTTSSKNGNSAGARRDPWVVFRLFLMPFCVSSFAALVKGAGYVLVFPHSWRENAQGLAWILGFLAVVAVFKRTSLTVS